MPYYDYMCGDCGPFREKRPMAESAAPQPCPFCAVPAERAILTAPRLSGMGADRRAAFATNERSANEPRLSSTSHSAGCGCCSGASRSKSPSGAAKSFPSARPWMISH